MTESVSAQARKLQTSGDLTHSHVAGRRGIVGLPARNASDPDSRCGAARPSVPAKAGATPRSLMNCAAWKATLDPPPIKLLPGRPLPSRARELADKYVEDEEVISSANTLLLQKLNLPGVPAKGASSGSDLTFEATQSFVAPPPMQPTPRPQAPPVPQPPAARRSFPPVSSKPVAAVQPSIPAPLPAASAPQPPRGSRISVNMRDIKVLGIAVAAIVLLLVVAVSLPFLLRRRKAPVEPIPSEVVAVQPTPVVTPPAPELPGIKLSSGQPRGQGGTRRPAARRPARIAVGPGSRFPAGDHTLKFDTVPRVASLSPLLRTAGGLAHHQDANHCEEGSSCGAGE